MATCTVCGGENFEKHEGFMYCATCQTQSQDYFEQEYDYHDHTMNIVRQQKSYATKSVKPNFYDDGNWTTWEAFNYILYGMTEEIKKCGVTGKFKEMIFKLWAAYLRKCHVAFISKHQEKMPKLGFCLKRRDARILYNIDLSINPLKERGKGSKSCSSRKSNTSVSSVSSQSKRSLALRKGRIVEADYQDHLSSSTQNLSGLADETLESLGKSSELETTEKQSDKNEGLTKSFKVVLSGKDYEQFKRSYQSKKFMMSAKDKAKKDVRSPGKNKLLSIIHLALLMTGSQVQLSDLLRFIRESHLSYAKVTHFFPRGMKFPKNDLSYVEVISDTLMPTHLRQRKITSQLAYTLKVEKIATPNMNKLVDRYCQDLNLPERIAELSKMILANWVPPNIVPRSKTPLPCYEAWAMVSVIFVLKLLFGLNDKTEIFLSRLAHNFNSVNKKENDHRLFEFEGWQKFIECRKTFLTNFHYPTQEQLCRNYFQNSKDFLSVLVKESKDEYRSERFIPYSKYYIDEKFLSGVKQTLGALSESQKVTNFEFQPSLTPQVSHTESIIRYMTQEVKEVREGTAPQKSLKSLPEEILRQSFRNCDVQFAFDPKSYFKLVEKNSNFYAEFDISNEFPSRKSEKNRELLLNCSSNYWVFEYPTSESGNLNRFKEEILERTPENFQWLISECARMLEMNVRDVYDELLRLEKKLRPVAKDEA